MQSYLRHLKKDHAIRRRTSNNYSLILMFNNRRSLVFKHRIYILNFHFELKQRKSNLHKFVKLLNKLIHLSEFQTDEKIIKSVLCNPEA